MIINKSIQHFLLFLLISGVNLSDAKEVTSEYQINLSVFMLANFTDDSPHYGHIEISKKINQTDRIGIEFLTWQYNKPLGIPYGKNFDDPNEAFPGSVKDIGLGLTYQRFFHDQFFYKIHATAFHHVYLDEQKEKEQSGFMLFTVARAGYKWEFANGRYFIEPSIAATSWPINTNMPEDFQEIEDKWPSYFLFEPGLNIGMRF